MNLSRRQAIFSGIIGCLWPWKAKAEPATAENAVLTKVNGGNQSGDHPRLREQ